ncbi:S10 family serine carboxypeptidase-like protein [Streptomyces sp. NPDC001840]
MNRSAAPARVAISTGEVITYTARWASYPLPAGTGDDRMSVSATSYLADGGEPDRPVMFLFNGGPGASSSPLHMNAFGPRTTRPEPDGGRSIEPNKHTLLGCADLVFVDPVGTGFNPEVRPGTANPYLSVHGDAAAVESLIRRWRTEHDRLTSPIYIVGESYGGFRLATMCESLADLPVAGLVFISPLLDASASAAAPGNDLTHVFALPTMALTAWHHGRASAGVADPIAVYEAANDFAQGEYLCALHRGDNLGDEQRRRVGERIARLLGLPIEQVLAADLRVSRDDFVRTLLSNRKELVGRLDARISAPAPTPRADNRPAAVDDPALGVGQATVIRAPQIAAHLYEQAAAPATGSYISLSLELAFRFDYRGRYSDTERYADATPHFYRNPMPHVAHLLDARPETRVLAIGGYYDLAVPLAATAHALSHAQLPRDRVEMLRLAAGHSLDRETLPEAAAALRRLVDSSC